jgi:polar amino acid transport system substrate-binding protein
MKVRIAYIEEAPYYYTDQNGKVTGADVELAETILRAAGATLIEYVSTSFEEFLPGVQAGKWDMNVPIFVSAERAKIVAFSVPVWAVGDGFLVLKGNPKSLDSYEAVAEHGDARLALITGQVQIDSAKLAGVKEDRMVIFKHQADAIAALLEGKVDAYASTSVGNRVVANKDKRLEDVAHVTEGGGAPVGAFSFSKSNHELLNAVNDQLWKYLGSEEHRKQVGKYGITANEINSVLPQKDAS